MTPNQYIHIAIETWGVVFCLIAAACVHLTEQFDRPGAKNLIRLLVTDAALNLFEALAYYYRGNVSKTGYIMVRVTNFSVFVCGYLLSIFVCRYLGDIVVRQGGKEDKRWNYMVYTFCGIGIVLLVLSRIFGFYYSFDEYNRYYRLPQTYWLINAIGIVPVVLVYLRIIACRKLFKPLQYTAFVAFISFPVAGLVIQTLHYGVSVYNIANTICLLFLFVAHEMEYAGYMVERERKVAQEREELLREQIHLCHSQIQPHFIYNSLGVIRSLMQDGSEEKEVLDQFSRFLRGSVDMLAETECIRAEQEFATVESYLYMEKRRFEDKLTVYMDISGRGFFLPAFTVQTLVENAVRHGIRKKKDGAGTLTIKSCETDTEHIIEVADDGVGFDVSPLFEKMEEDGHKHIGLANLKKRLELMCGGTLDIESEIGKGTLARVHIPKRR